MGKQINVTHIDNGGIKEEIGERKKVDLVHEKMYKDFNIDTERMKSSGVLKQIPHEWLPDILSNAIHQAKQGIKVLEIQDNIKSKMYTLAFESSKDTDEFSNKVNSIMFQSINSIIESKGLNPQHYHRSIVFTIKTQENNSVLIEY